MCSIDAFHTLTYIYIYRSFVCKTYATHWRHCNSIRFTCTVAEGVYTLDAKGVFSLLNMAN